MQFLGRVCLERFVWLLVYLFCMDSGHRCCLLSDIMKEVWGVRLRDFGVRLLVLCTAAARILFGWPIALLCFLILSIQVMLAYAVFLFELVRALGNQ